MAKCPRGTKQQINANYVYLRNLMLGSCTSYETLSDGIRVCKSHHFAEEEGAHEEDYLSFADFDAIRADKRSPPTIEDEVVYLFVNCISDVLIKCWEGTPCLKPKLIAPQKTDQTLKQSTTDTYLEQYETTTGDNSSSVNVSASSNEHGAASRKYRKDNLAELDSRLSAICRKYSSSRRSAASYVADSEDHIEEETVLTETEYQWKLVTPDEDVSFSFYNGASYKGRMSRRLMEGEGVFFWEDGGKFEGEFVGGTATGYGRLEFPDQCVYEGGVYKGFRHGEGLQCMVDSPLMYSGEWWLGRKCGSGLIMYDNPEKCVNFYKGNWANGMKEGFGYRCYPSGSKYIGYWHLGKRDGTGIMFWSNKDIYRGQWKDGKMEGYGEYTWDGFINKTFTFPRTNTHRGFWSKGKRNGPGIFELSSGSYIETVWYDDQKNGPGAVVCLNGSAVVEENLFRNDKPAQVNDTEDNQIGYVLRNHASGMGKKKTTKKMTKILEESQMISFMKSMERAKAVSIPIHTPVHSIDVSMHLKRLQDQKKELYIKKTEERSAFSLKNTPRIESINGPRPSNTIEMNQELEVYTNEEKLLRYAVMINLTRLKVIYEEWATVTCEEKPSFPCVLLRLFLWEMLIQYNIPRSHFSLVDIDNIIAADDLFLIDTPHDPFERIQFWQFLHILISLSWYIYGKYVYAENIPAGDENVDNFLEVFCNQKEKYVLSVAFSYFLEKHIFDSVPINSDIFRYKDLIPLEGLLMVYRTIGEPHSAKDFLCAVCKRVESPRMTSPIPRYYEKLPPYKLEGRNAIIVSGVMSYLPSDDPLNNPEIPALEKENEETAQGFELTRFAHLQPKGIVQCLTRICPNIMEDSLIINMEYQLTFLEFYKVVIACAELSITKKVLREMKSEIMNNYKTEMEEYERLYREYEKQKEMAMALTKKASQTKKGKKIAI